jgi:hypothetical protein
MPVEIIFREPDIEPPKCATILAISVCTYGLSIPNATS